MDNSASIFNKLTKFITAIDLQDYVTNSIDDEFIDYFEHLGNKSKLFSAPLVRLAYSAAQEAAYTDSLIALEKFRAAFDDNDPDLMLAFIMASTPESYPSAWDFGSAVGRALELMHAKNTINNNLTAYAIYAAAARLDDDTIITPQALARAVSIAQNAERSTLQDVTNAMRGIR